MTGYWRRKLTQRTRRCVVRPRSVVGTPGDGHRDVEEPGGVMPWAEKTLWIGPREPILTAGVGIVTVSG
jgi:hypothetical protein